MAKAKPKIKAKPVTIKLIDEFMELEAERKELNRQSRVIERRTAGIRSRLFRAVEDNNGLPFTKGKYRIAHEMKTGRVSWKDEFISAVGIEEANDLLANVPPVTVVVVS